MNVDLYQLMYIEGYMFSFEMWKSQTHNVVCVNETCCKTDLGLLIMINASIYKSHYEVIRSLVEIQYQCKILIFVQIVDGCATGTVADGY